MKRTVRGMTGLELILVLAVVSVVLLSAPSLISALRYAQGRAVATTVLAAVATLQSRYAQSSAFTGLNTAICANLGAFPDQYVVGRGTITASLRGPWGGAIQCQPQAIAGAADVGFQITLESVPSAICREMPQNLIGVHEIVVRPEGAVSPLVVKASHASVDLEASGVGCGSTTAEISVTSLRL